VANFAYVARTSDGREISGQLAGNNPDDVVARLHQRGMVVMQVIESRARGSQHSSLDRLSRLSLGKASGRDLALFSNQFSTVLESGIPLVRGLRGLAADSSSRPLARALSSVSEKIEQGASLSDAMGGHPEAFNTMYVSMIRAGERAGTLDQIVAQLAIYLEKVDAIRTKVRSAMVYPAFVTIFVLLATLFLLLEIVPTFADVYRQMGQDLPTMTRLVVTASDLVREQAILVALQLGALALAVALLARTRNGRYLLDAMILRLPIFGTLIRKAVMSRFARTFGILVKSGLPIMESLDMVAGAAGNQVVVRAVSQAKQQVAGGRGLTEAFRATGKFPEMVLQLMATGEDSGNLDTMLLKASDFYDRQVEAAASGLASLIEPVMVVLVGGMIGFIVVSMFLPIFQMGDAIMKGGANL
jgi:type IV pilus assembly protein PilC